MMNTAEKTKLLNIIVLYVLNPKTIRIMARAFPRLLLKPSTMVNSLNFPSPRNMPSEILNKAVIRIKETNINFILRISTGMNFDNGILRTINRVPETSQTSITELALWEKIRDFSLGSVFSGMNFDKLVIQPRETMGPMVPISCQTSEYL